VDDLASLIESTPGPDGSEVWTAGRADLQDWAWERGISLRSAEIKALERGVWPRAYLRNRGRFSLNEQARLLDSRVLITGLGGLGGVLLEILARTGVGRIRCLDPDAFEESNLNRQLLSCMGNIGAPKARAAPERIEAVNPAVELETGALGLDQDNAADAFEGVQVVLDGLGDMDSRLMLWSLARGAGLPVASAGVAGNSGFAATVTPRSPDPAPVLAASPGQNAESRLGTQGPAVHLAASVESSEALALLLGRRPALEGRLLLFDLDQGSFDTVNL
jgi:molybdopterin/thiamine biosynthesis adenylyltransferase